MTAQQKEFSENILGFGKPHPRTSGFVGDFLAMATTEKTLFTAREEHEFVGVHAGLTEEEMTVPFIAIETEKRQK